MTDELLQRIAECKIVPVVKIDDVADTLPLMKALAAGGIMSAEITFRTACGPDALALAAKECPDMLVGAGTVINKEQAEKAVACGAKFIVGPGFSKEVADVCRAADVLYLPGVVTPTEVMMAIAEGLHRRRRNQHPDARCLELQDGSPATARADQHTARHTLQHPI